MEEQAGEPPLLQPQAKDQPSTRVQGDGGKDCTIVGGPEDRSLKRYMPEFRKGACLILLLDTLLLSAWTGCRAGPTGMQQVMGF